MIVGDSFCREPYLGWPRYLHQLLAPNGKDMDFLCQGVGGVSWWTVRRSILDFQDQQPEKFHNTDIAIVIHPPQQRPHCELAGDDLGIPIQLPRFYSNSSIDEPVLAISLFYKYIHSPSFFVWAYQQWLREVESLLPKKTKIIHWFFDNSIYGNDIHFRGHVIESSLDQVQTAQFVDAEPTQQQRNAAEIDHQLINHFTKHNNKVIAQELFRMIQTDQWTFDISKLQKI